MAHARASVHRHKCTQTQRLSTHACARTHVQGNGTTHTMQWNEGTSKHAQQDWEVPVLCHWGSTARAFGDGAAVDTCMHLPSKSCGTCMQNRTCMHGCHVSHSTVCVSMGTKRKDGRVAGMHEVSKNPWFVLRSIARVVSHGGCSQACSHRKLLTNRRPCRGCKQKAAPPSRPISIHGRPVPVSTGSCSQAGHGVVARPLVGLLLLVDELVMGNL